jgi:hypothetical protein
MGWDGLKQAPENGDWVDRNWVEVQQYDRIWGPVFVWHTGPPTCAYINAEPCGCRTSDVPPCVPVPGTGRHIATKCTFECNSTDRSPNAKPSSEHGGGVNVAFGSGRAVFIRETIDYKVYRALMTLNQKFSSVPAEERNFILDDTDVN